MKGAEELKRVLDDLNIDYEETEVDMEERLSDSENFKAFNCHYRGASFQFSVFEAENPEFNGIGLDFRLEEVFDTETIEALENSLEDLKQVVDNISDYK